MKEEQVRRMATKIIAAAQPTPLRFYHLCWWRDGIQCLHAHHTTEPHPIFLSMPGQVLTGGLSRYQWKLVTGRILYLCEIMDLPLNLLSAPSEASQAQAMDKSRPQVTDFDRGRLQTLLTDAEPPPQLEPSLEILRRLLEAADVVHAASIGADIVTMNSQVRLWNDEYGREMVLSLVYPEDAGGSDFGKVRLSILTRTGLSMLGRKVGDTIDGDLRICELLYQPEAAGDFDL